MSEYIIEGGRKLSGNIDVSGSKNATLPILAATILNEGITEEGLGGDQSRPY